LFLSPKILLHIFPFSFLDVGFNEGLHGVGIASTLVRLARLVRLGEELDGGEATDAVLGGDSLVLSGIELSDDDVITDLVGEFFVSGLHTDAVTAPGGEELDHNVLVAVEDDGVEVINGELDDFSGDDESAEDEGESDEEDLHDLLCFFDRNEKVFFLKKIE